MIRSLACAFGALTLAACVTSPSQAQEAAGDPVVTAPAGAVRGEALSNGVDVYRGIPYAAPPVGWRRWRPPAEAERWDGVRDATAFGPACHQPVARGESIYAPAEAPEMSEDCLSLNVWVPESAENAPVFFWIHGGSLTTGSGSEAAYNGARMAAEHGVIVVTINYRLGVLGYLAHPELSAESRRNISGNYGLMDQIAALQWVEANIGAFGGNADNVTIAGESAGALSVMYLMSSPEADGLFDRAIAQSAYMLSMPELRSSRYGDFPAETVGVYLQGRLGQQNLAGLRGMDAQELTVAALAERYAAFGNIDGVYLPEQMVTIFDRGEQAPVPLLAGFNEGEILTLRFLAAPPPETAETYEAAIRTGYGDLADEFLRLYPSSDIGDAVFDTPRDGLYGWTAERLMRRQSQTGQPGYLYFFDHAYPATDEANLHAFHAAEIPYVFGAMDAMPPRWPRSPDTPEEHALTDAMMSYWATFATDGAPRAEGEADWPTYGSARNYMAFEDRPVVRQHLFPGMFELHEAVVCRRRAAGGAPWNWNFGVLAPPIAPATAACP